jgi:hypothetical protein
MASSPDAPRCMPKVPTPVDKLRWLQAISADHEISPMASKLAIAIATRYLNNETGMSFVGMSALAAFVGVSRSAAKKAKRQLTARGYLATKRRGLGQSNLYRLAFPRSTDGASTEGHSCSLQEGRSGDLLMATPATFKTATPATSIPDDIIPDDSSRENRARACAKRASCDQGSFDRFWQAWPNKVGKPAAQKAFAKNAGEIDAILDGVARYVRGKPPDRQWLNPATFLNQRRWEDAPAPEPQSRVWPARSNGRGGFATLLAESIAETHEQPSEKGRNSKDVLMLPVCSDHGPGASGDDDGGVSRNVAQLSIAGSFRRL